MIVVAAAADNAAVKIYQGSHSIGTVYMYNACMYLYTTQYRHALHRTLHCALSFCIV